MNVYLILPSVKILNANAMSSTITVGFPAMTAWLGGVHALQRKLNTIDKFNEVKFIKTGVVCNQFDYQVYEPDKALAVTANPLTKKGERPAIIEAARVHLTISLVIEIKNFNIEDDEELLASVKKLLPTLKLAGGDILNFKDPQILYVTEDDISIEKKMLRQLMPGYALIERRNLISQNEKEIALDSLLNVLCWRKTVSFENTEQKVVDIWRQDAGWLVPIAVGFHELVSSSGISNLREEGKKHSFVEPIVTIGEFKMVHHFSKLEDILWEYVYDLENGLFICRNV